MGQNLAVRRQPFQQHCWHMHHFLVTAALQICVPRVDRSHAKSRSDLSAFGNIIFSSKFSSLFDECMQNSLASQPGIIARATGLFSLPPALPELRGDEL